MEFIEKRLDQMEKYKPLYYGGDTEQIKRSLTEHTLDQQEQDPAENDVPLQEPIV